MAKYRVIAASVNIHAGVLGLEPHQARARLHRLRQWGNNRYEVLDPPVTFKRGEEFEYEGELPKSLVEAVDSCRLDTTPVVVSETPIGEPEDGGIVTDLVTDLVADDGVAEPPPDQSPQDRVTVFVTDLVESVPDDGVSGPPAGAKKRSRRKPAA